MDLGDRGRGVRLAFKVNKHLEGRPAERLLNLRQKLVEGDRRYLTVQASKLRGPCR